MKKNPHDSAARREPPAVSVRVDESAIDLRLWARQYVHLLCTIEGIALIPSTMERAS